MHQVNFGVNSICLLAFFSICLLAFFSHFGQAFSQCLMPRLYLRTSSKTPVVIINTNTNVVCCISPKQNKTKTPTNKQTKIKVVVFKIFNKSHCVLSLYLQKCKSLIRHFVTLWTSHEWLKCLDVNDFVDQASKHFEDEEIHVWSYCS